LLIHFSRDDLGNGWTEGTEAPWTRDPSFQSRGSCTSIEGLDAVSYTSTKKPDDANCTSIKGLDEASYASIKGLDAATPLD